MRDSCSLVVVGVGGQGVLSTARTLGTAAITAGIPARVGQIYGLSQRGGSVEATVRIDRGKTAFISPGEADVVLALEPLEAERALPRASRQTTVLMNTVPVVPASLTQGRAPYPEVGEMTARIARSVGEVITIDATAIGLEAGNRKLANIAMLGRLARTGLLPFDIEYLIGEIDRFGSSEQLESRRLAFNLGYGADDGAATVTAIPTPRGV